MSGLVAIVKRFVPVPARRVIHDAVSRSRVPILTSLRKLTLFAIQSGKLTELTPRAVRHIVESAGPPSRIPILLEIGANDGEHTAGFVREFGEIEIHAFEPEPRAIQRFKQRRFNQHVKLYEIALSDRDGEATFYQSGGAEAEVGEGGWDYSGSIRPPKEVLERHSWITFKTSIPVPIRSLDSWAAEFRVNTVDFVWMDVQGAEADVIRGGTRLLRNTRFLYTEYSDAELYAGQVSLAQLAEMLVGWRIVAQFPNDVLFENTRFADSAEPA